MSAEVQTKRKRAANWHLSEKMLLLYTVEQNISSVENKKTDGITMRQKSEAWERICTSYNSSATLCHRSAANLKAEWELLKKAAKKYHANRKMQANMTGGGPPSQDTNNPVYLKVLSLINPAEFGFHNPYDSDAVMFQPVSAFTEPKESSVTSVNETRENFEVKEEAMLQPEDQTTEATINHQVETVDWSCYTPQMLRTSLSPALAEGSSRDAGEDSSSRDAGEDSQKKWTSRKRLALTKTSLERVHENEIKAIRLQMKIAKQESAAAMEKHSIEMEIKREMLKQEKIRTRMLLLEKRNKFPILK